MYNVGYVCTCGQADRACRGLYSSYTMHVSLECKGGVPRGGSCSSDALELVLVQVAAPCYYSDHDAYLATHLRRIFSSPCEPHLTLRMVHELLAFTERVKALYGAHSRHVSECVNNCMADRHFGARHMASGG